VRPRAHAATVRFATRDRNTPWPPCIASDLSAADRGQATGVGRLDVNCKRVVKSFIGQAHPARELMRRRGCVRKLRMDCDSRAGHADVGNSIGGSVFAPGRAAPSRGLTEHYGRVGLGEGDRAVQRPRYLNSQLTTERLVREHGERSERGRSRTVCKGHGDKSRDTPAGARAARMTLEQPPWHRESARPLYQVEQGQARPCAAAGGDARHASECPVDASSRRPNYHRESDMLDLEERQRWPSWSLVFFFSRPPRWPD